MEGFQAEGGSTPFSHAWVYLQTCLCAEPEVMFGDALQEASHLSGRQGEAEQPTGRNEVSGTVNGSGQQAHSAHATALSKSREQVHEVDEPGLSSSADGKGK